MNYCHKLSNAPIPWYETSSSKKLRSRKKFAIAKMIKKRFADYSFKNLTKNVQQTI